MSTKCSPLRWHHLEKRSIFKCTSKVCKHHYVLVLSPNTAGASSLLRPATHRGRAIYFIDDEAVWPPLLVQHRPHARGVLYAWTESIHRPAVVEANSYIRFSDVLWYLVVLILPPNIQHGMRYPFRHSKASTLKMEGKIINSTFYTFTAFEQQQFNRCSYKENDIKYLIVKVINSYS